MQLTNMLFKTPESKHGGDLVAFNIWRGRDHGLPGYNAYRELLGLRKAKSFSEMNDVLTPDVMSIYCSTIILKILLIIVFHRLLIKWRLYTKLQMRLISSWLGWLRKWNLLAEFLDQPSCT